MFLIIFKNDLVLEPKNGSPSLLENPEGYEATDSGQTDMDTATKIESSELIAGGTEQMIECGEKS